MGANPPFHWPAILPNLNLMQVLGSLGWYWRFSLLHKHILSVQEDQRPPRPLRDMSTSRIATVSQPWKLRAHVGMFQ